MNKEKYHVMDLPSSRQMKVFMAMQDLDFSDLQTSISCQLTGDYVFVNICQPTIISFVLIT